MENHDTAAREWRPRTVWINRDEALRVCPISATGLWRISKSGEVRTTAIGRRIFFDLNSLESFMDSRATGGDASERGGV